MNANMRNTSRWDDTTIQSVIAFCERHVGIKTDDVAFQFGDYQDGPYRGTAYQRVPARSWASRDSLSRRFVKVQIGHEYHYPTTSLSYKKQWLPAGTTEEQAMARVAKIDARWSPELHPRLTWQYSTRWLITTMQPYGGRRAPLVTCEHPMEGLVSVTAHELMHIDQFRTGRRYSERECEVAAQVVLTMYRTLGL